MDHNYVIRHDIIDSGESRILKGASSITRVPTYFSPRCSPHPSFALHFFFLLSFSFHHFALKQPRYKRSSYVLGRTLVPVVSSSALNVMSFAAPPLCCRWLTNHKSRSMLPPPAKYRNYKPINWCIFTTARRSKGKRGKTVESGKKYNPNTDDI